MSLCSLGLKAIKLSEEIQSLELCTIFAKIWNLGGVAFKAIFDVTLLPWFKSNQAEFCRAERSYIGQHPRRFSKEKKRVTEEIQSLELATIFAKI